MTQSPQAYLDANPNEAQQILEGLLRLPSVAAHNRSMEATADHVEKLLQEAGFETRQLRVDGAPPYVYGEQRGRSPFTLLLYNHYDVQPEDPIALWDSPPFEPAVRDGNLYARGTADNKGELAARLAAIRALRAAYGELPISIRWIVEGEEEVGSPHFDALARAYADLLRADGALWEGRSFDSQDRPILAPGRKGLLYVEYEVQVMKRDAHSGMAPTLPNAAWRLLQALMSIRSPDGKVHIPGFYDDMRGPTPAEREVIAQQTDMDEIMLAAYEIKAFNNGRRGPELWEAQGFEPTTNIAGIISGYTEDGVKTVLPCYAKAKMDFRLVPHQNPHDVFEKLRAHLDQAGFADVKVTKLGAAEPVVTPIEHPFVQRIIKIVRDFSGKEPNITPVAGGTLPLLGALQRHVGLPGLSTPGNTVYWGSGAHAPNEHIRLSDLARAVRYNVFMFEALGKDLD